MEWPVPEWQSTSSLFHDLLIEFTAANAFVDGDISKSCFAATARTLGRIVAFEKPPVNMIVPCRVVVQRPGEEGQSYRCIRRIAAQEIQYQLRQHRRDQSEREHVEHDRDEDKCHGGRAIFHCDWSMNATL